MSSPSGAVSTLIGLFSFVGPALLTNRREKNECGFFCLKVPLASEVLEPVFLDLGDVGKQAPALESIAMWIIGPSVKIEAGAKPRA